MQRLAKSPSQNFFLMTSHLTISYPITDVSPASSSPIFKLIFIIETREDFADECSLRSDYKDWKDPS